MISLGKKIALARREALLREQREAAMNDVEREVMLNERFTFLCGVFEREIADTHARILSGELKSTSPVKIIAGENNAPSDRPSQLERVWMLPRMQDYFFKQHQIIITEMPRSFLDGHIWYFDPAEELPLQLDSVAGPPVEEDAGCCVQ